MSPVRAPRTPATANEVPIPLEGYPLPLRLPGWEAVLWWGPDVQGTDRVAVEGGRALVWDSVEACVAGAQARGLTLAWDASVDETEVMDFGSVVAWLRGQRLTLDPVATLDLWNLAGDVAASVGAAWDDRGRIADACHTKLTWGNVPYLVGADTYVPRWTPHELRYLRRRMLAALSLLQSHLSAPGRMG
jgi:hypothetical protein